VGNIKDVHVILYVSLHVGTVNDIFKTRYNENQLHLHSYNENSVYIPRHFIGLKVMTFKITIFIVTYTGKIRHPDTQALKYSSSDL